MVSTKAVVITAVAATAVAATAYVISTRRSKDKRVRRKKKGKSVRGAKSDNRPLIEMPSDQSLADSLIRNLEVLQVSAQTDGEEEKRLLYIVENMNPSNYSTRCRLVAAQWCILYNTINTLMAAPNGDQSELGRVMQKGMKRAWSLLDCSPGTPEERQAIDILMLDVAQRLRDPTKLVPVYERVLRRGDQMSMEEVLVLFTTAPLLGRWTDTKKLGAIVEMKQRSLKEFHNAAMQRPELPDYEVLYKQSCEKPQPAESSSVDLSWTTYLVKQFRIKLRKVDSPDAEKAASVRASIEQDWQEIPLSADHRLFRHGAIGHMTSASNVKLSMVGPWTANDGVRVQGYIDINEEGMSVRQTETYHLKQMDDVSSEWAGTYELKQDETGHPDRLINVTFDLEMILEVDLTLG